MALGDVVDAGQILVRLDPETQADEAQTDDAQIDLDHKIWVQLLVNY